MNEASSADSYEVASDRLERALARLEAGIRTMTERADTLKQMTEMAERLNNERDRLTAELRHVTERADRLDHGAAEVSERLVNAMETVKSVLAK